MSGFPDWLVPMAATLTEQRFTGPDWIFERKFDGIRLLAFKSGPDVRLYSRNRLPQNIPAVATAIAALPVAELILDGEITWDRQTAYHVFDVLWRDRSLTSARQSCGVWRSCRRCTTSNRSTAARRGSAPARQAGKG
jgi:ATP-dependent DNA ligase